MKIQIEKLKVGMKVKGMDKPWYATPFVSHRFTITSVSEIETLKACGVRTVDVETEEESHPEQASAPAAEATPEAEAEKPADPETASVTASSHPSVSRGGSVIEVPLKEELPAARQAYEQAKMLVQHAFYSAKMGKAFVREDLLTAVDRMIESILRNPDALASLSRLKRVDKYTMIHSVNASVLAMIVALSLDMKRESIRLLGTGMLLHDIGKTQIPIEILNKPGRLEPNEMELARQHALRGAEFLTTTMKMEAEIALPALESHERGDGSGYPYRKTRERLSEFGMIAAVVDLYDAMTSDRTYRKAIQPAAALKQLYGMANQGKLDLNLMQRFIRCLGIYPVGSCVRLTTGEVAIVARANRAETLKPCVLIVRNSENGPPLRPRFHDLAEQTIVANKGIKEVLDPGALGLAPYDILEAADAP